MIFNCCCNEYFFKRRLYFCVLWRLLRDINRIFILFSVGKVTEVRVFVIVKLRFSAISWVIILI